MFPSNRSLRLEDLEISSNEVNENIFTIDNTQLNSVQNCVVASHNNLTYICSQFIQITSGTTAIFNLFKLLQDWHLFFSGNFRSALSLSSDLPFCLRASESS